MLVHRRANGKRPVGALAAALIMGRTLPVVHPGARSEPAAQAKIDYDPQGAPYGVGELLVAYEPGTQPFRDPANLASHKIENALGSRVGEPSRRIRVSRPLTTLPPGRFLNIR